MSWAHLLHRLPFGKYLASFKILMALQHDHGLDTSFWVSLLCGCRGVAVGSSWSGQPDASTPASASMVVDYVRVFAKVAS